MRWYSLPPRSLPYPFLLVNMRHWKELRKRKFQHAILDSGVEIFKDKQLRDYPKSFLFRYAQKAEIVSKLNPGKVWVTIPDYPDDFNPGQFGDNIKKTLRNIEEFISIDGIEWLPVIQCRYLNIFSFYESCQRLHSLIGNYPRIAIGTVCKTRRLKFISQSCMIARKFFPKSWIHAFGLTLTALPKVAHLIDSFDSLACYFPRLSFKEWCEKTGQRPFPNASPYGDSESSRFFFFCFLERLAEIVEVEGYNQIRRYRSDF